MELKPREREILLEYFSIKGGCKYLNVDRIAYLSENWEIRHDNLLQIKFRAFQKLERSCEDEQKKTEATLLTLEEKAFESELENMLRSTGHLFPITLEQVAAFLKLGLDEEVSDDCKDPLADLIKKKNEEK